MFDNNNLIAVFLILGMLAILFVRRFSPKDDNEIIDDLESNDVLIGDDFPDDKIKIPGHESLYYSLISNDVFMVLEEGDIEYLEFFTSNGHECKYVNGKVVEVVNDSIVAIVHKSCLPD